MYSESYHALCGIKDIKFRGELKIPNESTGRQLLARNHITVFFFSLRSQASNLLAKIHCRTEGLGQRIETVKLYTLPWSPSPITQK